MQASLYLMLLRCIMIHPSIPILYVSGWSFSVAEGFCRAWRVSQGSCDHTVALQTAFCVVPWGAHSAYSCIITSKWLQKSMEYRHCWGHFPKPWIITVYIPVQLACIRFCKHSATYLTHYKSRTRLYSDNLLPWASYGYRKCNTGSVCSAFMKPWRRAAGCIPPWNQQHFFLWDLLLEIMTESREPTKSSILRPSWQKTFVLLPVDFSRAHATQQQTKHTWWFFNFLCRCVDCGIKVNPGAKRDLENVCVCVCAHTCTAIWGLVWVLHWSEDICAVRTFWQVLTSFRLFEGYN